MRYLRLLLILLMLIIPACAGPDGPADSPAEPDIPPAFGSTGSTADPIPGSTGAYVSDLFMQNGQGYFIQSNGRQSHIRDALGTAAPGVAAPAADSRRQGDLTLLGSPESGWRLRDHSTGQIRDLPAETVGMQLYSLGQDGLCLYTREEQAVTVYYYDYAALSGRTVCQEQTAWVPAVTWTPPPDRVWLLVEQDGSPVLRSYAPEGSEDIPLEGLSESPEDHNFSLAWAGERLLMATLPHDGGKIQLWMLVHDRWDLLVSQGVSCISSADPYVRLAADPAGWIYSRAGGTSVVSGSFDPDGPLHIYYLK